MGFCNGTGGATRTPWIPKLGRPRLDKAHLLCHQVGTKGGQGKQGVWTARSATTRGLTPTRIRGGSHFASQVNGNRTLTVLLGSAARTTQPVPTGGGELKDFLLLYTTYSVD